MKYLLILLLFSCSKELELPMLTKNGYTYTLRYEGKADAVMIEYYSQDLGGYCPKVWKEWSGNVHTFQIAEQAKYRGVIIFKNGESLYSNTL